MNEKKIFDKVFKGEVFEQQGYKYRFDDLVENEKGNLVFKVCWLPEFLPHSYFFDKLVVDCDIIIKNRLRYLSLTTGKNDEVDIYTEVSDLTKKLFVRKSLLKEIDKEISKWKVIRMEVPDEKKTYILGVNIRLSDKPYHQNDNDEYITIHFDIDINYIEDADGPTNNRLKLNPDLSSTMIWNFILDSLYDQDLPTQMDEVIIPILEPEIKIGDYDIYYNSSFGISSILGLTFEKHKVRQGHLSSNDSIFI